MFRNYPQKAEEKFVYIITSIKFQILRSVMVHLMNLPCYKNLRIIRHIQTTLLSGRFVKNKEKKSCLISPIAPTIKNKMVKETNIVLRENNTTLTKSATVQMFSATKDEKYVDLLTRKAVFSAEYLLHRSVSLSTSVLKALFSSVSAFTFSVNSSHSAWPHNK